VSNSYPMKVKAGWPRIRVVGTRSIAVHVLLVDASENLDTFLLFIINEQGLFQSFQSLRLLIF
jgi:hypothetical protein